MQLQDKLIEYMLLNKGILATNFYNYETLSGILIAAKKSESSIILQLSESSINYMGLNIAVNMAKTALKDYAVQGWVHLDHGSSIDMVAKCLDAGFDSVMLDASEKTFKENIKFMQMAVRLAKSYNVNVEGELGYVAKLGQPFDKNGFTKPEDALEFVNETNISALAISIGSSHGFYKETPNLDFDLLSKIHEIVKVPLVLHGSSGIPDEMLLKAVQLGITKVNLATEIKNTFMNELQKIMKNNTEIDLRKVFPIATESVVKLICEKLEVLKGHIN